MGNSSSKSRNTVNETPEEFGLEEFDGLLKRSREFSDEYSFTNHLNEFLYNKIFISFNENNQKTSLKEFLIKINDFISVVKTEPHNLFKIYFFKNSQARQVNGDLFSKDDVKGVFVELITILESSMGRAIDLPTLQNDLEGPLSPLFENKASVSFEEISREFESNFPRFQKLLQNSIMKILKDKHFKRILPMFVPDASSLLTPVMYWFLCSLLPECYLTCPQPKGKSVEEENYDSFAAYDGEWDLLYSSKTHGQSFNRFTNHVFNYPSPTIAIFQLMNKEILIAASDEEWKDEANFWGGVHSMAFRYFPSFKDIACGKNIIYLKISSRINKTGLILGGTLDRPLVYISTDLDTCEISMGGYFKSEITSVEVWGTGGSVAAIKKRLQNKMNEQDVQNWQKIKITKENWNDNPDRQILEMAGICSNNPKDRNM